VSGLKCDRFAAARLALLLVLPPPYPPPHAGEGRVGVAPAQYSADPSGTISGDPPQVQQPASRTST
jgi:hypothetical protein